MQKKNFYVILIVLLALLLIAIVVWVFDRRINKIRKETEPAIMQNFIYKKSSELPPPGL
jgi:cbb3-type cytochrome oxidase subunit 3